MILYESPYRVVKSSLTNSRDMGDDRVASVSREISKLYAENGRGTLGELVINFTEKIQVVNLLLYSRK